MADLNYVANAQADQPKTSLGPPLAQVRQPLQRFLSSVRAEFRMSNVQPLGIQNPGNLCYRNSVLTMLLSSQRFISYIQNWHLHEDLLVHDDFSIEQVTRNQFDRNGDLVTLEHVNAWYTYQLKFNMLRELSLISRGLHSYPIPYSMTVNSRANCTAQERMDDAVQNFWLKFCDPRGIALGFHGDDYNPQDNIPDTIFNTRVDRWYKDLDICEQQDANEFMVWMIRVITEQLDNYATCCLPNGQRENFDALLSLQQSERYVCSECEYEVRRRRAETSLVHFLNVVFPDDQWDKPFEALKEVSTLHSQFDSAFREVLEQIRCSRCKKISNISKHLTMRNVPEIMLVQINRNLHRWNKQSRNLEQKKNLQAVEVPEVLDATDWLEHTEFQAGSVAKYRLSGVVSHSGESFTSGHYVSYIRDVKVQNGWYEMNDEVVNTCTLQDFNDSKAAEYGIENEFNNRFTPYLLLYELDTEKSSIIFGGRALMNVNEGTEEDTPPTQYIEGRGQRAEPVESPTASADKDHLSAIAREREMLKLVKAYVNAEVTRRKRKPHRIGKPTRSRRRWKKK